MYFEVLKIRDDSVGQLILHKVASQKKNAD